LLTAEEAGGRADHEAQQQDTDHPLPPNPGGHLKGNPVFGRSVPGLKGTTNRDRGQRREFHDAGQFRAGPFPRAVAELLEDFLLGGDVRGTWETRSGAVKDSISWRHAGLSRSERGETCVPRRDGGGLPPERIDATV